jgi:hypothetical protein
MPSGFAENFVGYTDENLDAIIEAGGGLATGKTREGLRDCLQSQILVVRSVVDSREWDRAPLAAASEFLQISKLAARLLKSLGTEADGDPFIAPKLYYGFVEQGQKWAQEWALLHKNKQNAASGSKELVLRGRKHRLHGSWPQATSFTTYVSPHLGEVTPYGEVLALMQAIQGLQRIRTWAEGAAQSRAPGAKGYKQSVGISRFPDRKPPYRDPATILVGLFAYRYQDFFKGRFTAYKLANDTKDGRRAGSVHGRGIAFLQACLGPLEIDMSDGAIEVALRNWRKDREIHDSKLA